MPRRLLALVVAVGMVGGALAVRAWLDRRDEDKANPPELACVPELVAVCQRIGAQTDIRVVMTAPNQTVNFTVAAPDAVDGWLTFSNWPDMAEARRADRGLPRLFARTEPLARSRIGMAVWPDRLQAMRTHCGRDVDWKCVGSVAEKRFWKDVKGGDARWGPVKLGAPNGEQTALGLAAFGAATVDYFDRQDVSKIDFDDDAYRAWAHALVDATPTTSFPSFDLLLAQGPALQDVYVGIEAQMEPAVRASARPDKPVLIYPSAVSADVVLATVSGRAGERLRDIVKRAVRDELINRGWTTPNSSDDGLPEAGVLDALRQVWKEAA